MAVLASSLDTRSETYLKNRQHALDKLSEMEELYSEAAQGGGKEAVDRLASRGKMVIRERIAWVLDRDSPFLEISPLAAWRSNYVVGSGFVVGIGVIEGVECVILGHDPSVRAGAFNAFNSKKLMRGLEIARENRMPYIQFVESAGCRSGRRWRRRQQRPRTGFASRDRPLCRIGTPLLRDHRTVQDAHSDGIHCIRRIYGGWSVSAGNERLQHIRKEPGDGRTRKPTFGEDGDGRRRGKRRVGRRGHAYVHFRSWRLLR